jgi:hypothetical protein
MWSGVVLDTLGALLGRAMKVYDEDGYDEEEEAGEGKIAVLWRRVHGQVSTLQHAAMLFRRLV